MPTDKLGLSSNAIIGRFFGRLEQEMSTSWMPLISWLNPSSDQESETYKFLGRVPQMREWIGGRQPIGLRSNGITIENKVFEATLEILKDDLRRDKTGQIMARIDDLAIRAAAHWAKLGSTLIQNGDTTTNGLCYDGQMFFDTDHSEGNSGTLSNALTASDYSELNVGTATNPTADELADVIMKMIQHQYSYLDDQGEPLNEGARKFAVMVPIGMWGNAQQAVSSKFLDTGFGTRDNPLLGTDFSIERVIPNVRLDWTAELGLFRTDGAVKGLIMQEEQPIEMSAIAEGSELEFMNRVHNYGIEAIRNVGYGMWQYATKALLS